MTRQPARITSSGPQPGTPMTAAALAGTVDHVIACAEISGFTRSRLRFAATELRGLDALRQERDALRAEVERLKLQGGHSSRLPATTSPAAT